MNNVEIYGSLLENTKNQPFVQIAARREIHSLTKSILQLYETFPLLLTNSNTHNEDKFSDSNYEAASPSPKAARTLHSFRLASVYGQKEGTISKLP
jgi:hypothetical protein